MRSLDGVAGEKYFLQDAFFKREVGFPSFCKITFSKSNALIAGDAVSIGGVVYAIVPTPASWSVIGGPFAGLIDVLGEGNVIGAAGYISDNRNDISVFYPVTSMVANYVLGTTPSVSFDFIGPEGISMPGAPSRVTVNYNISGANIKMQVKTLAGTVLFDA